MKQLILGIFLLSLTINSFSKSDSLYYETLKSKIEILTNKVDEVKRDQLNYKIEKDLLKDTYSSNYETIQIIIMLIVGIFAVLSYLGFKGISSIKKEYASELEKLREIKGDFEHKLKELTDTQETVKGQLVDIRNVNEEQSKKIQLLEMKDKAIESYNQQQYYRCLDYIAIGLAIEKDDIELTKRKAFALHRLGKHSDSTESYQKVITLDPKDSIAIQNLAELLLIQERFEEFDQLAKSKKDYFKTDSKAQMTYFESIKLFMTDQEKELKELVESFVDKQDLSLNKNYNSNWEYSDILAEIAASSNENTKPIMTKFIQYLRGEVNGNNLKKYIDEIPKNSTLKNS